jgi:dTDP-4-dehydrorhamnose 3,5-epimerase
VFSDARGSFFELWRAERFAEAGLDLTFVQDNISRSVRGTVRGMHFQHPEPQGKLVTVLHGEVFDVVADVRAGSPTFGKWWGTCLAASRPRQLYVPPGFAHGFQALSDEALFAYKPRFDASTTVPCVGTILTWRLLGRSRWNTSPTATGTLRASRSFSPSAFRPTEGFDPPNPEPGSGPVTRSTLASARPSSARSGSPKAASETVLAPWHRAHSSRTA